MWISFIILPFFIVLCALPLCIQISKRFGIYDLPDGKLKTHTEPVSRLGGIAIYLSFILSILILTGNFYEKQAIIYSVSIIFLIGLTDDLYTINPYVKLAGQLLAVTILVFNNIHLQILIFPDSLNIALTYFWLLGIMNSLNLLDIMDGLAGIVTIFISIIYLIIGILTSQQYIYIISCFCIGSFTGFLLFNFSVFKTRKIFLGDSGSLTAGLFLGIISIWQGYTRSNTAGFLAPLLILYVCIFDILFVTGVRVIKNQSIFKGSPDHFGLFLKNKGFNEITILLLFIINILITGCFAIFYMFKNNIYLDIGIIIYVCLTLIIGFLSARKLISV